MDTSRKIIEILEDLIAIPSGYPPGKTAEICAYAVNRLKKAGYNVDVLSRQPGVDNVIARLGVGSPSLVFNAHVDTVAIADKDAWNTDPFQTKILGGNAYGLGAGNCKGSMAVQIWLAEEIAKRGGPNDGEVVFTFVGDEENLGPDGLYYLREIGAIKPDILVCGAQTQLQAITEERGVLWIELITTGHSAHAGEPQNGDNAIERMVRLIGILNRDLTPKLSERSRGTLRSTMNIGIIEGGKNTNAVPDLCRVKIDRRLMPEEDVDMAVEEFSEVFSSSQEPNDSWNVKKLTGTKGFSSSSLHPAVGSFHKAIAEITKNPAREVVAVGASDARYFADDDIILLTFGPGNAKDGHKANEFVPVDELEPAAMIQLAVVSDLLGLGS